MHALDYEEPFSIDFECLMPETAAKLLEKAIGGDQSALAELLTVIAPQIRARLAGKIADRWRSVLEEDDVLQVTYMECILQISRFKTGGIDAFLAWVTRIAENNLIDAVRGLEAAKRPDPGKRVQGPRSDSMASLVGVLGATYTTPSRVAAREEADAFLKGAIAGLPRDYARVIQMYDLDGKPIEALAQELGRSPGAIYMLRARAHDRLKQAMGTSAKYFSQAGASTGAD
jgi:RNA polymerase sigma-70 factor (ECF subfamily)